MIYSASYYYASHTLGFSSNYYFKNQAMYVVAGLALMIGVGFIRPGFWKKFGWIALFLAFAVLIAVRIPGVGHASHGAYRWIKLPGGVTIQVAEPIKIAMIVFMAMAMTKYKITDKFVLISLFVIFAMMSLMLLLLSNNLSTAIIVFLVLYFTMMVNFPKPKWFVIVMVAGIIFAVLAVIYIDKFTTYNPEENFRITRIRAWRHPTDPLYADDQAYQSTQALYAIASGGFFGKGLGRSLIKYVLPEPHNDYILAIVFEELGILGVLILTFLFIYLLYRIFVIYLNTKNRFSGLLCLGVFFHIAFQVLINYAVTLGLFPTTGVTLTFISAGGSAVLFTLIEIGLVLAVDRENKERVLYLQAEKALKKEDPLYRQYKDQEEEEARMRRERNRIRKRKLREREALRGRR